MAQPATPGCIKGCIIAPIVTFIVIILIAVIAVVAVFNMTPAQLGIEDMELYDGETFRTLGLADIKIKDFITYIDELLNPEEGNIVKNPVDNEAEKATADSSIADSSATKKEDGSIDYSSIVTDKLTYPTAKNVTYKDTTLAYIFNQMVTDSAASSDEAIKYLQDINASINEVTILESGESASLRIVASIDTTSISAEVNAALEEAGVGGVFSLPEKVYVVSYQTLSINAEGELKTTSVSLKINDSDNPLSTAIFKVLADKAQDVAGENNQTVDTSKETINGEIGKAFVSLVTNLGKPIAVNDHEIVVETYTENA